MDLTALGQSGHSHANDAKNGLSNYGFAHFGFSLGPVSEYHGYFLDVETVFPGFELHFYLKGITYKLNFIQLYGFQNFSVPTHKSCSGVVKGDAGHHLHVLRGEIAEKHPAHGPINYIHSPGVPGSN